MVLLYYITAESGEDYPPVLKVWGPIPLPPPCSDASVNITVRMYNLFTYTPQGDVASVRQMLPKYVNAEVCFNPPSYPLPTPLR